MAPPGSSEARRTLDKEVLAMEKATLTVSIGKIKITITVFLRKKNNRIA